MVNIKNLRACRIKPAGLKLADSYATTRVVFPDRQYIELRKIRLLDKQRIIRHFCCFKCDGGA